MIKRYFIDQYNDIFVSPTCSNLFIGCMGISIISIPTYYIVWRGQDGK